jgi:hypothetical protein
MIVAALSACGPQVSVSDEDGSGSEDGTSGGGPASSSAGSSTPTVPDVATTDSPMLDIGTALPNITGQQLFAVAAVIDPAHPLQWLGTVTQTNHSGGATLKIELESLALDVQSTTVPRTPVGMTVDTEATVNEDGSFVFELPGLLIPGAANPITGSDIVGDIVVQGVIVDTDLWCGTVSGTITQPLMLDLQGSTFAGTRLQSIAMLPGDPIPAACP